MQGRDRVSSVSVQGGTVHKTAECIAVCLIEAWVLLRKVLETEKIL